MAVYQDSAGTPRTPPAIVAVAGAYLWALTPTTADITAQTSARIDAPATSGWPYLLLATEPVVVAPAPPPPAPVPPPPPPPASSLFDLSGVIEDFATGTYTVSRPSATTYDVNGRVAAPTFALSTFLGCVQPTTGADLKRLPEGLQTEEIKTVWGPFQFLVRDILSIDGETWEAQRVERWAELGAYWRAFVSKVNKN